MDYAFIFCLLKYSDKMWIAEMSNEQWLYCQKRPYNNRILNKKKNYNRNNYHRFHELNESKIHYNFQKPMFAYHSVLSEGLWFDAQFI